MAMDELDKLLYDLGYIGGDEFKKDQIGRFRDEAVEYMRDVAGVPVNKLNSKLAYSVKSIWCENRDKGTPDEIIKKNGLVVSLIAQLRR